jgi:hypothetical protein
VEKDMTVYIVQEMRGRDISDAASFGDLEICIPAKDQSVYSTQPFLRILSRKLSKFSDKDFLLLSGDPVAIALAGAVASRSNMGKMKMLKWDRLENTYYPLAVDLNNGLYTEEIKHG